MFISTVFIIYPPNFLVIRYIQSVISSLLTKPDSKAQKSTIVSCSFYLTTFEMNWRVRVLGIYLRFFSRSLFRLEFGGSLVSFGLHVHRKAQGIRHLLFIDLPIPLEWKRFMGFFKATTHSDSSTIELEAGKSVARFLQILRICLQKSRLRWC